MTAFSSEDVKQYGRWSRTTMNTAEVPLDFHYSDSIELFYANKISFEFLKKFFETKNDIIFLIKKLVNSANKRY